MKPFRMTLKRRITKLYTVKAMLLLFMPLILILVSGEVRSSISNYVYSDSIAVFIMLLTIASTLFINNGITDSKWYNVILGLSLTGVALTPHLDYSFLHYTFAIIFFLGSVFVMIFYSSEKQRIYKIIAGAIVVLAMLGTFLFNWYSLLIAEWIGLVPICIHFIGEALHKID
ncbi:DUF7103 family protein [Tenacibaculum haliotis]|uniref:DUF7103 family protein n=1 Tax=Tenacibaculum haliotis TaxID=1888914 RepID=UPI0021B03E08|nr:hypothetical protein [Tenacibaculum haliotis]MCT4698095.1 hypothetical protein [Tenacibaculum haliotis]